jgi:ribosomal protein S3
LVHFVLQNLNMGQKTNCNIFYQPEKLNKQLQYFEKKVFDHSIVLKKNLEIKNFTQKFFKTYGLIINKSKILYLNNLLYIFLPYYQQIKFDSLSLNGLYKTKMIKYCFNYKKVKKIKILKNKMLKKSIQDNIVLVKFVKYIAIKNNQFLELNFFLETFFIGLTNFLQNKFYIFIILERQNKKLVILQNKNFVIKRKHKFINLRKYKNSNFFKQGISLIATCIASKNPSKLLAKYIAVQIQKLKQHNFFIQFVKSILNLFINKNFYSKIKGIKIQIKGRINNYPRTKTCNIKILNRPTVLTKNASINLDQKIAYTQSGTFGIKI